MMQPLRTPVFLAVLAALVVGAVAPAEAAFLSTEQEIAIGREAARELESEYGVVADPARTRYVSAVGQRLAAASDRRALPWTFKMLNTRTVNAISLPGGFVYVTKGMMAFVRSDDEMAFVLGHEVGHVDRRHHVAIIERNFFFSIVLSLIFGGRETTSAQIANLVGFLLTRGYSRDAEFEADRLGLTFAHRAGFNAAAALTFMERLREAEGRDPSQFEILFRTHPALTDRITRVREQLRTLGYRVSLFRSVASPGVLAMSPSPS